MAEYDEAKALSDRYDAVERCADCGEPNDNGEGWDGLCGSCADRKEAEQELHDAEFRRQAAEALEDNVWRQPPLWFIASLIIISLVAIGAILGAGI